MARIKTRASLWRESHIPADLARRGVTGVEVLAQRYHFELRALPWNADPPPTEYRFLGSVRALESGSVIDVEVGMLPFARFGKVSWVLAAVGLAVAWYLLGVIALGFAAAAGLIYWLRDRALARGTDPVVELYFDLLRRALEPSDESRERAG